MPDLSMVLADGGTDMDKIRFPVSGRHRHEHRLDGHRKALDRKAQVVS